MKIAIFCTSIYKNQPQPEFALINRKRLEFYCKRHNYDLYYLTDFVTKAKCVRNKHKWNGIYLIRNMMNKQTHDAYMWIDNDIFIVDIHKRIEDYVQQSPKDMIYSRDINWSPDRAFITMVNTGIYILKNTPTARKFINKAWELRNFTGHGSDFKDQATFNMLLINEFAEYADILPLGTLQQLIFHLKQGEKPFSIHVAGSAAKKPLYTQITNKYIYSQCPKCQTELLKEILRNKKHFMYRTCAHCYYNRRRSKTDKYICLSS